jgi:hypothetical protein
MTVIPDFKDILNARSFTSEGFSFNVLGMTRYGKTTGFQKLILDIYVRAGIPIVIFDLSREKAWESWGRIATSLNDIVDCIKQRGIIRYSPHVNIDEKMLRDSDLLEAQQRTFNSFAKRIWEFQNRFPGQHNFLPVHVVVEEAHNIAPVSSMPLWLRKFATEGLKRGISLTSIAQRGATLNNTLKTQSQFKIYFYQQGPDLEYLIKNHTISREDAELIAGLKKYEYVVSSQFIEGGRFIKYPPLKI